MYIVVKRTITIEDIDDANKRNEKLTFKNIFRLRSFISKINNKLVYNGKNLDIFMRMQNVLEYCDNYCMTSGFSWNYDRDEMNDDANENNDAGNYRINNKKETTSKYSQYKTKSIGTTLVHTNILDTEVVVPLKYLSTFWRYLYLPLLNCEIELHLSWSRKCKISETSRADAVAANQPNPDREQTKTNSANFQIISAKLYFPQSLCL